MQRALQAEREAERHRSLAQMVAGAAHELNTPLGIVNTAVDMIEKRIHNEKLTVALQDNKAAQVIVEDMQEAADIEREPARFELNKGTTFTVTFPQLIP